MRISNFVQSRIGAVAMGTVALAMVGAGSAVAAGQIVSSQIKNNTITSFDVKDGTLQTRDLTKNNFARFTSTETVVTAMTPVSSTPAYGGNRVVDVPAAGQTPLVTLVLDKGTWKLDGTAQFRHFGGPAVADPDYGVVTVPGLQSGFSVNYTSDVPEGGPNAAQVAFSGTIKITANDTPVIITGSFTGARTGQAGAYVQATQYEYVKKFKNGTPN